MKFVFWLGLLWLGYVYVGYPLLVGLLAWVRRVRPVMRDDFLPTVAVLIVARNEEKDIGWKVTETLGWDYPADRLEVLVASDASDDRTDEILRAMNDSRLTVVRMEKRSGKNAGLNRLVGLARGDLLFFTDANAHIETGYLRKMVRHFADKRVGCVTGNWRSVREKADHAVSKGARLYWSFESLIKYLESQFGSVLACVGSIFCIRRSLYVPLDPDLANDLELPSRIGHAGYWIRYEPEAQVSEKDTRSPREEFARRRRICAQGMLAMWKLRKTLWGVRGWQFFSYKLLRWITLIPVLLVALASYGMVSEPLFLAIFSSLVFFFAAALAGGAFALAGRSGGHLVPVCFYFLLVITAGLTGVIEACLGRRYRVWEVPSLSRGGVPALLGSLPSQKEEP